MFVSQLIEVSPTAVPIKRTGAARDRRPGFSALISNVLNEDIKIGGPASAGQPAQVFTVRSGAALQLTDLEPDDEPWVKTTGGSGSIEVLWQGVSD